MSERWRIEMATLEPLRSPLGLLKVLITVSANLFGWLVGSRWEMMMMMTGKRGGEGERKTRRERVRGGSINHHCSTDSKFLPSLPLSRVVFELTPKTEVQALQESGDLTK